MEFDLRQLEAFVSVVDNGGFGAASRVLHLSQAAVSERIANLENAIDMRLLDRHSREIRPTAIGRRFYVLARELLEHRNSIYLELAELAGVVRGILNIGASTIPGEYILPQLLPGFLSRHPSVVLNVQVSDSSVVMDLWYEIAPVLSSRLSSRTGEEATERIPEAKRICELLGVKFEEFEKGSIEALPDPKSWAKEEKPQATLVDIARKQSKAHLCEMPGAWGSRLRCAGGG